MPQRLILAVAAALPGAALALELGEAQVRSRLGEPLDARIPIVRAAGEDLERACFSLVSPSVDGVPALAEATAALRRSAGKAELRVTTPNAVADPASAIAVRVACPRAAAQPAQRSFVLLPEPPVRAAVPASSTPPVQGFTPRAGDSLASLARALGGPTPRSRREWIASMRAAHPTLAALGEEEAVPAGTSLDLASPKARVPRQPLEPASAAPAAPAELAEPAARPTAKPAAPARPASPPQVAQAARAPSAEPAALPTPVVPSTRGGFVLKLSAPEVDLTRTRHVDDRQRQQLRERQLVLDADDQVSALLAMRHSLKQLETRVAELQLKLSALPPTPAPAAAPASSVQAAPPVEAAPPVLPTAPVVAPAEVPPAPAATVATKPPAAEAATPRAKTAARPKDTPGGETAWWLWAAGATALLLLLALVVRAARRRGDDTSAEPFADPLPPTTEPHAMVRVEPDLEPPVERRPAVDSDAVLATRLPENSSALRRRYIEERFPEVVNGTVVLDDPLSVIKGARLFYEDGALPRAVELLQFAIEDSPGEVRTWLALFEVYRLERLTGQYAELAQRFREVHAASDAWRKVRCFGREIDPGNPLYREDAVNTLETIGPREGRRLAASLAHVDPIAENWLHAPMDFENEVLANELRNGIMASASLTEQDLVPNPMPALRRVEMFTVA